MRSLVVIFVFGGFFLWEAGAVETSQPPEVSSETGLKRPHQSLGFTRSLMVKKGDQLFVKGFSGKLTLLGKPGASSVSVRVKRIDPKVSSKG